MNRVLKVGLAVATAMLAVGCAGQQAPRSAHAERQETWHIVWTDSEACLGTNAAIAIVYGASGDELGRTTPEPVEPDGGACSVEYEFIRIRDDAPFTVTVPGYAKWSVTDEQASAGPVVFTGLPVGTSPPTFGGI